MNAADEFFKLARPDLEAVRRIELLDDEPTRAFSRLSALIDPALHAELKARAALRKLTMGELIEPTLREIAEPKEADKSTSARGLCFACLFSCALLFGAGYLLGRV